MRIVIPENGVLVIPEFTLYKLNYEISEDGASTMLLTAVFACGEDFNMSRFKEDCWKSIRYVDSTTRLSATGPAALAASNEFKELSGEDFKYLSNCSGNNDVGKQPNVLDLGLDTKHSSFHLELLIIRNEINEFRLRFNNACKT